MMKRWGYAVLAQALAWLCASFILESVDPQWYGSIAEALLAGVFSALLSILFKEPQWRAPMQTSFSLLVWLGLHGQSIPSYIWLFALILTGLLFGGGITGKRAPLYLTQQRAFEAILCCIPDQLEGKCLDVGAGIGSFMLRIAPLRTSLIFEGIERAPLTCLVGTLRCRILGCGRIRWGDLWKSSLHEYQVVYAFLSPEAMDALWKKARKEMQPGSLLIVNAFAIQGVKPDTIMRYGEGESDHILCYRLPPR